MSAIEPFAENIWTIDGPNVRDMGITFSTRMTVAKLANGSLWLESPVPLSFETITGIADLGPIKHLVSTTPRHVWRLENWHTLFPGSSVWAPRTTLLTLNKAHLTFTGILGNEPNPDWAADFDQLAFKGNPLGEEVLFFHRPSRTVILGDLIQVQPVVKGSLFRNAMIRRPSRQGDTMMCAAILKDSHAR